ncbi:hypothetical protein MEQU1_001288 [Malassezia equina]|uniref:Nucleoporin Nup159/Nup146 N-terminal domain-containing protein n=1 Tax=Malassezia equina TaxID=1381935 RepID=A0AAF0IY52_9BASI|nr:hypothetical protein MEQU1_001288 [Malassezia equina]
MPVSRAEAGEAPAPVCLRSINLQYLFLRQIAKDVTVRVSEPWSGSKQQPLSLCSIASTLGLLVAATTEGLALYDLSQLHKTFKEGERNTVPTATALHTFPTDAHVQYVAFADHDSRLVCALTNGRLLLWESGALRAGFSAPVIAEPPEANSHLLALEPNPGDRSTLCLAVYGPEPSLASGGTAYIMDLSQSDWSAPLCPGVTAVNWSTRGKQLVAGCQSGELVQLTPEGEVKAKIPPPPDMEAAVYVDDVQWLENHAFLVTYNTVSSSSDEPSHEYELQVLLRDAKADHITFASLPLDVAPPFGDTTWWSKRYTAALRAWASTKHLIFMSCTASTDVGVISCSESSGPGAWNALELEETSRIVLPFSSQDDTSDTAPLGIALDLTAKEPVLDPNAAAKGEDPFTTLPPMPILFIYTSDGVLLGYHIINTDAKEPYAGMLSETQKASNTSSSTPSAAPESNSMPTNSAPAFGAVSAFGSSKTPSAPAFGTTSSIGNAASSAKPAFGATSAFGASAGSATPAFGTTSAFGNAASNAKPVFGSTSAFGAAASSTPAFGATSAFGSSTSTPSSAFGKPSFGVSASSSPGFGAFGGSNSTFANVSSKLSSAFGSDAKGSSFGSSGSAFGGNSAFSSSTTKSAFGGSAFSAAAGISSAFGSVTSQGNVFGSGSSFHTPQAPVFGTSTPKAAPVSSEKEPTPNDDSTAKDAPNDHTFSFGTIGNILENTGQAEPKEEERNVSEESSQKAIDTKEPDVDNAKSDQPDSNKPSTDVKSQSALIHEKDESQSMGNEDGDEKQASTCNSAKEDSSSLSMEAGLLPSTQQSDTDAMEPPSHDQKPEADEKSSSVPHEESNSNSEKDAAQEKDGFNAPPVPSTQKEAEKKQSTTSSSPVAKSDSPSGAAFSFGNSFKDAAKTESSFSFAKPAETSTTPETTPTKAPESHPTPAEEKLESKSENTASLFAQVKKEEPIATSTFSFSKPSQDKPSFSFSKLAEDKPSTTVEPPSSNLPSDDKSTSAEGPSKTEVTLASLHQDAVHESNSSEAREAVPSTHALAIASDKSSKEPVVTSTVPPVTSAFGTSMPRGTFTQAGTSGVLPAFSAFSGQNDKPSNKVEAFGLKSSSLQDTMVKQDQPVDTTKNDQQLGGVRLTTPVPQIDLSKLMMPSVPKQENELQTEFVKVYATVKEELDALKAHAMSCSDFFQQLEQCSASTKTVGDVKNPESWVFADMDVLGPMANQLTKILQKGVFDASILQNNLEGLESTQVKAEIKKEEVARFLRARQDPDFAKLVRIRHLGPEHVENQWRLRRSTHMVRERMQELQDFLNSVQRTNSLAKQGLTTMRAPSLDSIYRSADNMTRIVSMRLTELEKMERELSTLIPDLSRENTLLRSTPRPLDSITDLDVVLPSVDHPQSETPDMKACSAAEALLNARLEPLLTKANDTATNAKTQSAEHGIIELHQIRQPMRAPELESKTFELPKPEEKPPKVTNFLATSTPHGIDYGASAASPATSIQSAFRTSALPLLASSKPTMGSATDSLPQQYTTFEGLVQPRPLESESKVLTLEEFVAQEDEDEDEEYQDQDEEEDSYDDGYDDYDEEDFGDDVE